MLSLSTLSHETILDSFLPAGFLRLCSHLSSLIKDPSYSTPSFVHMHTASLSSWRVRSVHEALCWTLTLIISNPYNKLTGSPGPISQMRKLRLSKVISLVWGCSTVNRRAGIWTRSCPFEPVHSLLLFHITLPRWWPKIIFEMKATLK